MNATTRALLRSSVSAAVLATLVACSSSSDSTGTNNGNTGQSDQDPAEPGFDLRLFDDNSTTIDNPWLPMVPGTTAMYAGENDDGEMETIVTTVSHLTRTVNGVDCVIVVDRAYVDGELEEETFDWYAQDIDGNVWYFGEDSNDYEDGAWSSSDGSWEAGLDVAGAGSTAIAGIIMKAGPTVGDSYRQEYYAGEAEDEAEIVATDHALALPDGSSVIALQIRERNPLEPDSAEEYKYYVAGEGLVAEETVDGSVRLDRTGTRDQRVPDIDVANFSQPTTINHRYLPLTPGSRYEYSLETDEGVEYTLVEVLEDTRVVMGITTRVLRDRVYLDDVLIEDTHDWYAQDDDGNVWYFGETVDNYTYDDAGNLVEIDNDGAWEAGVDGAQPGIVMPANPRVGDSYRQEYRQGEAEDLGAIIAVDEPLTLEDGRSYVTLKTMDWNPLEEDSVEFKYYGEGVGLVRETDEDGEEVLDLLP